MNYLDAFQEPKGAFRQLSSATAEHHPTSLNRALRRKNADSELIIYKKCEAQLKRCCLLNINLGPEGCFRDPGFDQNTVRDSGKRKIS